MPGSPNKLIVNSLIQTLQHKDQKLYEALLKIHEDVNKSYSALFDGILPISSGKNLDLSEVPKENLPDFIAYIDQENTFEFNQDIIQEYSQWTVTWLDTVDNIPGTIKGHFGQIADGEVLFSSNLFFDGLDWILDDGTDGSALLLGGGNISLIHFDGTDLFEPFAVDSVDRIIRLGNPVFYTDADTDEIVLANTKFIRGANFAGDATLPMINLDANDLVELGSNPEGATTGEGNISIARAVAADLPDAGATRNGIIIINKDNNRLCYYVSGNRYYLTGTAF